MPDWTRAEIRQRFLDHGHHYLDTGFANDCVQEAAEEFVGEHDWPWRETETTFVPDEPIENLGPVRQVFGSNGLPLEPTNKAALRDTYGSLTAVGTPVYYWVEDDRIGVYPTTTDELTVVHDSTACWVDADGENPSLEAQGEDWKPIAPPQARECIVLLARARAKSEAQDHDEVERIRGEYAIRLEEERSRRAQVDEMRRVRITKADDWA